MSDSQPRIKPFRRASVYVESRSACPHDREKRVKDRAQAEEGAAKEWRPGDRVYVKTGPESGFEATVVGFKDTQHFGRMVAVIEHGKTGREALRRVTADSLARVRRRNGVSRAARA